MPGALPNHAAASPVNSEAVRCDGWISELEAALRHVAKVRRGMWDAKYHGLFKLNRAFARLKEAVENVERERGRSEIAKLTGRTGDATTETH